MNISKDFLMGLGFGLFLGSIIGVSILSVRFNSELSKKDLIIFQHERMLSTPAATTNK